MTVRQFISNISNLIKAVSEDDWVSPKFLFSLSKQAVSDFLKKENSGSRLTYKLIGGWSEIGNVPMIEVPITDCNIGVNQCDRLMRSKFKLPEMYESKFGGIIKQVMSLNLGTEYVNIFSPKQWLAASKREYGNTRYFFFIDGYLYIPVKKLSLGSPDNIRIEAYFKDKWEVAQFIYQVNNSCEECKLPTDPCKSPLDYEIVIPTFLEDDVNQYILQKLSGTYLKIVEDEYPNLSSNDKTNQRDKK